MTLFAFIYKDAKIRMYLFTLLLLAGAFELSGKTITTFSILNLTETDGEYSTEMNANNLANSWTELNEVSELSDADNKTAENSPAYFNLACNNNVMTLFSDDCTVFITPDMILEGSLPPEISDNDFILRVVGDDVFEANEIEDNIVNDAGRFEVVVSPRNPATFPIRDWSGCWGYITVEDRKRPQLINEYEEELFKVKRTYNKQEFNGDVGMLEKEGMFNIGSYTCFSENTSNESCERPYQTLSFQVDKTDMYILELETEGGENGLLALFREMFNVDAPCENIIQQTNERNEFRTDIIQEVGKSRAGLVRMAVQLEAERNYVALVSIDDCLTNPLDRQPFTLSLYSENNGYAVRGFGEQLEVEVYRDLLCGDVSYIWNNANTADMLVGEHGYGAPAFDDCSMDRVWFEDDDVVNYGDCGQIYFVRNWYAEDAYGRMAETVTQTIRLRRPSISDIFRPAKTELADFDQLIPENLDEEGNPLPKITGSPYVMSAFGIQELNEVYCNVGASYQDISEFEICTGVRKIIRQWTLLNWCDTPDQFGDNEGLLVNYTQIIKVGNVSPPTIYSMPEQTISTGLFDCLAEWRIPPPQFNRACNNCDINVTVYKLIENPIYDRYGREIGEIDVEEELMQRGKVGDVITRLEQGYHYRARYFVIDGCGNQADPVDLYFHVKDETDPVAVCNGSLNVSVDGQGFARISTDDIDEGSWDNCGEVSLYLSRILANENLRNSYLMHVYGLSFSALKSTIVDGPHGEFEVWEKISDGLPVLRKENGIWYSWWHPEVYILCLDIETQLSVEMLVIDGDGSVEGHFDGHYNGNVCWVDVNVENKLAPVCIAPVDIELQCTELPSGFDPQNDEHLRNFFGGALAQDHCSGASVIQTHKVISWDCNAGSIIRFFQAESASEMLSTNLCRQVITVLPSHDYEIKFPKDVSSDCAEQQGDTLAVAEIGCDLLTINVKDDRFAAVGSACYQLRRTYQVINWCEYDGESDPITVSRDVDCDGVLGDDDVFVLVRQNNVTYIDSDNNEGISSGFSPCGNGAQGHLTNSNINREISSIGYWKYTQHIDVFDTTSPEIRLSGENIFCNYSDNCLGDVDLSISITDFCGTEDIALEIYFLSDQNTGLASRIDLQNENNKRLYEFEMEGAFPFMRMKGQFPIGNHELEIHAIDACGNQASKNIDFSVVDCLAPAPICISGISIPLQPLSTPSDVDGDGDEDRAMAIISASDFKISDMIECTGPIRHSINIVGERPDPNRSNLILTCGDQDTLLIEIFVWDNAYNPRSEQPDGTLGGPNYASCQTYVIIQDDQFRLCEEENPAGIAGLIITEEHETIEDVEVLLSGQMSEKQMTPADGLYAFMNLPSGHDYSITPVKDNDYLNGVTTFDLVMINKHILGTKKLDSPYKMIAADVNSSGTLTTFDLVHLRKLILGLRKDLPGTKSWRFIPANYRFPEQENPWSEEFPELMNFNEVNDLTNNGDFIAIKVGDMNGNAKVNRFSVDERTLAGTFHLQLEEQNLQAGEEYRVNFTSEELANIQGYQFTLHFDTDFLDLVELDYGLAKEENFGLIYAEEGAITTSWNQSKVENQDLFTLVFRAKTNAKLSDLIRVSSQYTVAEAYNNQDEMLDIALKFVDQKVTTAQAELYQNQPNPFAENTQIGFYLPKAGEATLTIHDMHGRTLKVIRDEYHQGRNQITLNRTELAVAAGVLYYTLESDDYTATKKMLLIEY